MTWLVIERIFQPMVSGVFIHAQHHAYSCLPNQQAGTSPAGSTQQGPPQHIWKAGSKAHDKTGLKQRSHAPCSEKIMKLFNKLKSFAIIDFRSLRSATHHWL
ncbi:hypothetical protein [Acetobacter lambici]|uniref:Fatty acid desaturase domain-containing protein n=1 Tax=Acetobacter lambici TaxID=1332824 RepID=A0ABT1F250_9PROT|nr:hypothetical protein [Acetobacter lambici]MCP1259309.1 hypothetical protein [Acetobacter lambici]